MEYKLFDEYITLQALLKELSIIHSGGAIKGFLAKNTGLFNGEDEKRRGKKLRYGDVITIPSEELEITIIAPTTNEIERFRKFGFLYSQDLSNCTTFFLGLKYPILFLYSQDLSNCTTHCNLSKIPIQKSCNRKTRRVGS